MKPLVIYHSADFDGLFCREIARKHFGEGADYVGWDYGEPEPAVAPDRDLFILDLSVPGLMAHPRLVWIDHHKTEIDTYPSTIPGYRIDGVAACRLAWQWFFGNAANRKSDFVDRMVAEPLAVRLAGEFDIWDKRDARAELFQHGLRSRDLADCWHVLLSDEPGSRLVLELLEAGGVLEYARAKENESVIRKQSFTVEFEGCRFLALNTARCNSLTFLAGLKPEHDGCLSFNWTGADWRVSLYGVPEKPAMDFSGIARKYGGGGHRQACGFKAAVLPFVQPEPMRALQFVHEVVEDELREDWPGHGGVMLSLEAIARRGLGKAPDDSMAYTVPGSPKQRCRLADVLGEALTLLLVAGVHDEELRQRLKTARDSARNLPVPPVKVTAI